MLTYPVIVTSYKGATDTRGSRIAAVHKRDSEKTYRASIPYPHDFSGAAAHYQAALALAAKLPFYDGAGRVQPFGHDNDHYYFIVVDPA
jgi:hypothetical protein